VFTFNARKCGVPVAFIFKTCVCTGTHDCLPHGTSIVFISLLKVAVEQGCISSLLPYSVLANHPLNLFFYSVKYLDTGMDCASFP
jgi:hypothetical protein